MNRRTFFVAVGALAASPAAGALPAKPTDLSLILDILAGVPGEFTSAEIGGLVYKRCSMRMQDGKIVSLWRAPIDLPSIKILGTVSI